MAKCQCNEPLANYFMVKIEIQTLFSIIIQSGSHIHMRKAKEIENKIKTKIRKKASEPNGETNNKCRHCSQ